MFLPLPFSISDDYSVLCCVSDISHIHTNGGWKETEHYSCMTDPACTEYWDTIQNYTTNQYTRHQNKVKVDNQNHRIQVNSQDKKQKLTAILHDVKVDSQNQY